MIQAQTPANPINDRRSVSLNSRNPYGWAQNPDQAFGGNLGSVDWYHPFPTHDYNGSNGTATNCKRAIYSGGTYPGAIVYDALGGALYAYAVGWEKWSIWDNLSYDGVGCPRSGCDQGTSCDGGNGQGGPNSCLGMPVTNSYEVSPGQWRQDFQKGYIYNAEVRCYPTATPGWASGNIWNNRYSYLFADAYDRNGAARDVGNATDLVHVLSGNVLIQHFSGGSFGDCCIMYDMENFDGNSLATNEAYLLRTGFFQHYDANGGWEAFGCPSRDEYATGDPGDAIQFFFRRVWNEETQQYENQHHNMYYDASEQSIDWNSEYTCDYVSQNPAGAFAMVPNETRTFTVEFRNTGTTTWFNNATSHPYDYICLNSTDPSGNIATSLLNSPYDAGLNWIDSETPCTMNELSVSPGNVATFTFTGQVATDRQLGQMIVYFRPYHSSAGLLPGWDGMNYDIQVVEPIPEAFYYALIGHFNADGLCDIGLYEPAEGRWFVASNEGNSFSQINGAYTQYYNAWLNEWGKGAGLYRPLVGDFVGDAKDDICVYRSSNGRWFVAENKGNEFDQYNGPWSQYEYCWIYQWGEGSGFEPLSGDFNGDGLDDICVFKASQGRWWVATNDGDRFSQANGTGGYPENAWLDDWGATVNGIYTPLVGDFNGDGTDDVGLYKQSVGRWFVAYTDGNEFAPQPYDPNPEDAWLDDWGTGSTFAPLIGDFNNDGYSDACVYQSTTGDWYVAPRHAAGKFDITVGHFTGHAWHLDFGDGAGLYEAFAGNFVTGACNIGLYQPDYGRWFIAFTQADSFYQAAGPYSLNAWYDDWGKESGSPKRGVETEQPEYFSLSHNYPNPFNPSTTISYTLPQPSHVRIDIFNILGQNIVTLVDDQQEAGEHQIIWNAHNQPSSIYFYRIITDTDTQTQKMLLLK